MKKSISFFSTVIIFAFSILGVINKGNLHAQTPTDSVYAFGSITTPVVINPITGPDGQSIFTNICFDSEKILGFQINNECVFFVDKPSVDFEYAISYKVTVTDITGFPSTSPFIGIEVNGVQAVAQSLDKDGTFSAIFVATPNKEPIETIAFNTSIPNGGNPYTITNMVAVINQRTIPTGTTAE